MYQHPDTLPLQALPMKHNTTYCDCKQCSLVLTKYVKQSNSKKLITMLGKYMHKGEIPCSIVGFNVGRQRKQEGFGLMLLLESACSCIGLDRTGSFNSIHSDVLFLEKVNYLVK